MSVGLPVSKAEVDSRMGDTSRALQKLFGDIATLKSFLDTQTDADLVALGYTSDEAGLLTAWKNDMWQLTGVYSGADTLPQAKDFRVYPQKFWGVGSF
jgi:hypothetical protein